jgi:hypothetical protein
MVRKTKRERESDKSIKEDTARIDAAHLLGFDQLSDAEQCSFFKMSDDLLERASSAWQSKVETQAELQAKEQQATLDTVIGMLNCLMGISSEIVHWAVPDALKSLGLPDNPDKMTASQKRAVLAELLPWLICLLGTGWLTVGFELQKAIRAIGYGDLTSLFKDDQQEARSGQRVDSRLKDYQIIDLRCRAIGHVAYRIALNQKKALALEAVADAYCVSMSALTSWYDSGAGVNHLDAVTGKVHQNEKRIGKIWGERQAAPS